MPEPRVRVCARLAREVTAALRARGLGGVRVADFPPTCGPWAGPPAPLDLEPGDLVVGGACVRGVAPGASASAVVAPPTCFQLLDEPERVDALLRDGAFLVTHGWLAGWRSWMRDAGLGPERARALFAESARQVALLDTGLAPDPTAELAAFAAFVGLPAQVVQVGTERLGLVLSEALHRQRAERAEQRLADHALVLDTLAALPPGLSEPEVADALAGLARMLCGAARTGYFPVQDGVLGAARVAPEGALDPRTTAAAAALAGIDAVLPGADGFVVRLGPPLAEVGRLAVERVAFPLHLPRYRDVAAALAQAGFLAVRVARHLAALERSRDELRRHCDRREEELARRTETLARTVEELRAASERIQTLRSLVPVCSGCRRIRDDAGFRRHLEALAARAEATDGHGLCPECQARPCKDS